MIHAFQAKNYGCLRDVQAALTPLHAFVGPNDSGKSTLLHGLRTLVQLASSHFSQDERGQWQPFDHYLPIESGALNTKDTLLRCEVESGVYQFEIGQTGDMEVLSTANGSACDDQRTITTPSHIVAKSEPATFRNEFRAVRLVRFDPDALRKPSGLIPETKPVGFLDERGHGLAGVYFAIRNRDDDAFASIVNDVRRHFSTIKHLRVKAVTTSEVVLEAELVDGTRVEAKRFSEGLLYYLAFAALEHLDPVSLLLVEEPENGLHPARIAEVIRLLRTIVAEKRTQIVMATHSPLVVNELRPEEVSIVTRKDLEGTKVARIQATPDFAERFKIYALGELWIAYANGVDEAPLLKGTEP